MSEKVKLLRLPIYPKTYSTGDDQRWTYEYTWEDFEEARKVFTSFEDKNSTHVQILKYFLAHPEKALEGGFCKERGYTAEDVRKIITGEKYIITDGIIGMGNTLGHGFIK